MVRFSVLAAVLAACGGGDDGGGGLVISTSFTIDELTGMAPTSHLDVLDGVPITMQISFDTPSIGHAVVGGCATTGFGQAAAKRTATGASAAQVQTEIFDYLPDWNVRLSLCDVTAQSSIELAADNEMNTGFTIGCIGLPASAIVRDGDDHPKWTSFVAPTCTLTILDAATNRVAAAKNFTLTVTAN